MADKARCPACVLQKATIDPLQALGIGVAIGVHVKDPHDVTEAMCAEHRTPYVLGQLKAAAAYYEATESETKGAPDGR